MLLFKECVSIDLSFILLFDIFPLYVYLLLRSTMFYCVYVLLICLFLVGCCFFMWDCFSRCFSCCCFLCVWCVIRFPTYVFILNDLSLLFRVFFSNFVPNKLSYTY